MTEIHTHTGIETNRVEYQCFSQKLLSSLKEGMGIGKAYPTNELYRVKQTEKRDNRRTRERKREGERKKWKECGEMHDDDDNFLVQVSL